MVIFGVPITNDISFLFGLFVLFFIYALYGSKARILSYIFAFYPAVMLYNSFPFTEKLLFVTSEQWLVWNKFLIFLLFFVPISIIISRFVFRESYESKHYIRALLYALACVSLVLLFWYSVLSFDVWYDFSSHIDAWFATPVREYLWYIAPLLLLMFV